MTMSERRSNSSLLGRSPATTPPTLPVGAHQVGVEQLDLETAQAPGDRLPDATHSADAHLGVVQVVTQQLLQMRAGPLPGPHHPLAFSEPSQRREREADGHVGHAVGQHAGRVGGHHATPGAGRKVDVVEADAHAAHRLQPGQRDSSRSSTRSEVVMTAASMPCSR